MKLGKPFMNYKNDLDERLTLKNLILPNFKILFFGLSNLPSHLNELSCKKVPKLLENYNTNQTFS